MEGPDLRETGDVMAADGSFAARSPLSPGVLESTSLLEDIIKVPRVWLACVKLSQSEVRCHCKATRGSMQKDRLRRC